MLFVIFTNNYNKYDMELLKRQINAVQIKYSIINIVEKIVNYETYIDKYICENMETEYNIIYFDSKYVILNNFDKLEKLLNNEENVKYWFDNNVIFRHINNQSEYLSYDLVQNGICKLITRSEYDNLLKDEVSCMLYLNTISDYDKFDRDIIIYKRLLDLKCPQPLMNLDNGLQFNFVVEIHLFIDKKSGFIKNLLKSIIDLNYRKELIILSIYNAFSKYNWIVDWIKKLNSKYLKLNIIKFRVQDNNSSTLSIIYKKQSLLNFRKSKSDYYFMMDNTHIIDNKNMLKLLICQRKDCIVPLLLRPKCLWSNFWSDISEAGYYLTSVFYQDIIKQNKKGLYLIPYFNNTVLLSKNLMNLYNVETYLDNENKYSIHNTDMNFCYNLRKNGINIYIQTDTIFGRVIKTDDARQYWDKKNLDLYLINDSKKDWENCYIMKNVRDNLNNVDKITIREVVKDAFTFILFTPRFCRELIEETEAINLWSDGKSNDNRLSGGYENHPTRDVHMNQIGLDNQWKEILYTYIVPFTKHLYSNYKTMGTNIIFVVKYSMDGQQLLRNHHDSSAYSINVTLNDTFTGGGTYFVRHDHLLNDTEIGQITMHPGRLTHYHAGVAITSGTRYILIGFID